MSGPLYSTSEERRAVAVQAAAQIMTGQGDTLNSEEMTRKVLAMAERFEKYINNGNR